VALAPTFMPALGEAWDTMVRVCNDDMRNGSDGYYTRKILGSPLTPGEENVLDPYVSVMFFCNFQPSSDPPQPCPQPKVLGAEPEEGGGGAFHPGEAWAGGGLVGEE